VLPGTESDQELPLNIRKRKQYVKKNRRQDGALLIPLSVKRARKRSG